VVMVRRMCGARGGDRQFLRMYCTLVAFAAEEIDTPS
jgi:hypothetical protein